MTTRGNRVPATHYEMVIALQVHLPKYLLAHEVAILQHYLPGERQRMLFATRWNTDARSFA